MNSEPVQLNSFTHISDQLSVFVLLSWLYDAGGMSVDQWFDSPFNEESPEMLGMTGTILLNAMDSAKQNQLVRWQLTQDINGSHQLCVTRKGADFIASIQNTFSSEIPQTSATWLKHCS